MLVIKCSQTRSRKLGSDLHPLTMLSFKPRKMMWKWSPCLHPYHVIEWHPSWRKSGLGPALVRGQPACGYAGRGYTNPGLHEGSSHQPGPSPRTHSLSYFANSKGPGSGCLDRKPSSSIYISTCRSGLTFPKDGKATQKVLSRSCWCIRPRTSLVWTPRRDWLLFKMHAKQVVFFSDDL